ncbi:class II fructose-bisphosphate aldolase [bacterium]|nr:class II fructose-bisphosphate aldolase [bacterium]
MLELLKAAQQNRYAVGAFNVYNLEGALAVARAAEAENSPAILQVHPTALNRAGSGLIALCKQIALDARVPMAIHLDHCDSAEMIQAALNYGLTSIMVDGSHLLYDENVMFTAEMASRVHAAGGIVEAELGRISGSEDGLTVDALAARLTDPEQARNFIEHTKADMLAVCIGNVHGVYSGEVRFDFDRLAAIRAAVDIPLVLHGTSGVPDTLVRRAIEFGVVKFNVNTEVRSAFVEALKATESDELVQILDSAIEAMIEVVREKLRLFRH